MEPLKIDTKSLDRIVMTLDEMHELLAWGRENFELTKYAKPMLKEGLLVVLGSYSTYFRHLDDEHALYGIMYKSRHTGTEKIIGQVFVEHNEKATTIKVLDHQVEQELLDIIKTRIFQKHEEYEESPAQFLVTACMSPLLALNAYVEFMGPDIHESQEPVAAATKQIQHSGKDKKRKDKQKKPMTKLRRVYYIQTIDDYCAKRGFNRHTYCWGVRGHFRHYKSGKVTFIKPYAKGKLRDQQDQYIPKTYIMNEVDTSEALPLG